MTIDFDLPKYPVGTKFNYHSGKYHGGKKAVEATVIGYHVEHHTDTQRTNVTYRIAYNFAGLQDMVTSVPRATVDRAMLK